MSSTLSVKLSVKIKKSLLNKARRIYGSDNQMAISLGITRQYMSDMRNGKRKMPMKYVKQIKRETGVDLVTD